MNTFTPQHVSLQPFLATNQKPVDWKNHFLRLSDVRIFTLRSFDVMAMEQPSKFAASLRRPVLPSALRESNDRPNVFFFGSWFFKFVLEEVNHWVEWIFPRA